jgi:hypothetical protein
MTEIEGTFSAVAVKFDTDDGPTYAQLGEAKTGTKQVLMQFKILDGEHAGRVVPWIGYFTSGTVDGTLKALRTAGMKGEDLSKLYGDNAQELNQAVNIVVEMKPNQDGSKAYPQVRWVNSPGGGNGFTLKKPMAKTDMLKFAAQMKSRLKQVPEVAGGAPGEAPEDRGDDPALEAPRSSAPASNTLDDDSLPF